MYISLTFRYFANHVGHLKCFLLMTNALALYKRSDVRCSVVEASEQ